MILHLRRIRVTSRRDVPGNSSARPRVGDTATTLPGGNEMQRSIRLLQASGLQKNRCFSKGNWARDLARTLAPTSNPHSVRGTT